jgi:hypothetical protein
MDTTYLIHLLTFSIHNQVQKMIHGYVQHDHHEDQVPNHIIKNSTCFFFILLKIHTNGIK